MQTFDQSLLGIYGEGLVELREALAASTSPHDLRLMIEQFTMRQASEQAAGPIIAAAYVIGFRARPDQNEQS